MLPKDSGVVRHWLNTVDGVRVTELPVSAFFKLYYLICFINIFIIKRNHMMHKL